MLLLEISATKDTPFVRFDPETGICQIGSETCEAKPEDAEKFWRPIVDWLRDYVHSGNNLFLTVWLRYYNTSTSKCLMELFDGLQMQFDHVRSIGSAQRIEVAWLVLTTPSDVEYDLSEAQDWLEQDYTFPIAIEARFSAEEY
jgi:hypothetical protein